MQTESASACCIAVDIPVVLGTSATGILVSLSLSRAGISHVLIGGDAPPAIPRLGESLNDVGSPELWRLYGREFREFFHKKNHIGYYNGNYSAIISLANPRRTEKQMLRGAPRKGIPIYPWLGRSLFHLDRVGFDIAIYQKAIKEAPCRFINGRVTRLEYDEASDQVSRLVFSDGSTIERPRYLFDCTGWKSPVAEAAHVRHQAISTPQRVVFTHYRRTTLLDMPEDYWCHGTNLMRLDKEYDGIDGMAWMIPIGKSFSVGMSIDAEGPHGHDDKGVLMAYLERACYRRGMDFRRLYPNMVPIEELRHTYFVRDRAWGQNWLLVGPTYITAWFPGSTGLGTVVTAAGMAPLLIEKPELGALYQKWMRRLLPFHELLDKVAHGPVWTSSLQVYRFFSVGSCLIIGRIAPYLRIRNNQYSGLWPTNLLLDTLTFLAWLSPTIFFILFGGMALLRTRLLPDRRTQAAPWFLYFHVIPFRVLNVLLTLPLLLWGLIPRPTQRPPKDGADDLLTLAPLNQSDKNEAPLRKTG